MNNIEKETGALIGLLVMLTDQTQKIMQIINENLHESRTLAVDRKFGRELNECYKWARSYEFHAEQALKCLIHDNEIEVYDGLRYQAQDLLCLNLVAYEHLQNAEQLDNVLQFIQQLPRREMLRDKTITKTIMK
jgi:hypothetical protein